MVTVYDIKLDFSMENMPFVRELYGRWDTFCRMNVEEVMDEVFSRYDSPDEVIRVGKLEVDLGVVSEVEFYERFPKLLKDKLSETFLDLLRHAEGRDVSIVSLHRDGLQVLLYFLMHGSFPAVISDDYRDPGQLLELVIHKNGYGLGQELRRYGERVELRRRLVMQFRDQELEKVVEVTDPSEALFIKIYTRSLILSWPRLRHPEIRFGEYRNVVWEVVWAYLLCEGRNFFSRKQLVRQTIVELALHFNLKFLYLLSLLTAGLKRMISGWLIMPELFVILSEIRKEELEKVQEDPGKLRMLWSEAENGQMGQLEELRHILSQPDSCRRFLQPMREEEIYRLVEMIIPVESPFIISYARKLERDRERGMLEGRAGHEFRILKWEFLFLVLLTTPVSAFHRKRLVWEVLRYLGAHYNIDPRSLLIYLCLDKEGLPMELQQVLQQLYREQTTGNIPDLVEALPYRKMTETEVERLRFVLLHPHMARGLLVSVSEEGIYRMVRILVPAESPFIISYARTLDREREKGMLEGKAGNEFRVLKWEFIFLVVLSAPLSAFSRKQFVRAVLGQIAAHYNLRLAEVAAYFYQALYSRKSDFAVGVSEVLKEWLREWRGELTKKGNDTEKKQERERMNRITDWEEFLKSPEITVEVLKVAGIEGVEKLLVEYKRKTVGDFLREHRKVLWEFLTSSAEHVRRLYQQLQMVEGLGDFLIKVYGRKTLAEVLRGAGIWFPDPEKLPELTWQEALIRKDKRVLGGMFIHSPFFLRQKRETLSLQEQEKLKELFRMYPDLLQQWFICTGSAALRQAVEEILRLQKSILPEQNAGEWLMVLLRFTFGQVPDLSVEEILRSFLDHLLDQCSSGQRVEIYRKVREKSHLSVLWERILEKNSKMEEAVNRVREEERQERNKLQKPMDMKENEVQDVSEDKEETGSKEKQAQDKWKVFLPKQEEVPVYINNAGMVVLASYFPRLFDLMKLTENGAFINEEAQVKALFAMQYLVFGQTEFPETDLVLNKLLVAYHSEKPLPLGWEFTREELELLDSLLKGAMGNWSMMNHTSVKGFRGSFLIRNGVMAETGDLWQLTVEEKSYDILLDSLPWSISPVKFPWMEKAVYVNWR